MLTYTTLALSLWLLKVSIPMSPLTCPSQGLVNGAIGTVISIKAHHISVQFDNMSHVYDVEKVKSKFMVMKKM